MYKLKFLTLFTLLMLTSICFSKTKVLALNDFIVPDALKTGDTVAIIAPANLPTNAKIQTSKDILKNRGYNPVFYSGTSCDYVKTDEERAAILNKVFNDPSIKAIICLRGGYGSSTILDRLDYEAIKRNRPIFVGYSDITAMLTAITQKTGLVTFHGPMLASNFDQPKSFDFLFDILSNPKDHIDLEKNIDGSKFISLNDKCGEGQLIGGNLTLISYNMGTPFEIDTKDKILYLEEIGEAPYRIHGMLTQLKLSGKLQQANGIIIGKLTECDYKNCPNSGINTVLDFLKSLNLDIPIIYNINAGHQPDPITMPIGANIRIYGNKITILEPVVK